MNLYKSEFAEEGPIENLARDHVPGGIEQIVFNPKWDVRFQPIFSFFTGEVFGYRVDYELASVSSDQGVTSAELFSYVERVGKADYLEKTLWEQVLTKWSDSSLSSILFLPVTMYVVEDVRLTTSFLNDLFRRYDLPLRRIVLEITDTMSYPNLQLTSEKVQLFRHYGYSFALGNLDHEQPWLHRILLLRPDYVNVASKLVMNVHEERIQFSTFEVVTDLARKLDFQVIAQGISNVDDLHSLLGLGIHFGQGSLLEQMSPTAVEARFEGTRLIQEWLISQNTLSVDQGWSLNHIVKPVQSVDSHTTVAQVVQYFNEFKLESGIVVVQDETPIGLVMRDKLFQRLAFQYGHALYWNREIHNVMDQNPLMIEVDTTLETASRLSMARHRDHIYDSVIVTRRGKLVGVITVRDMLNAITESQMELAKDANPLTGLPGNRRIEREIEKRIRVKQPFAIIYADLDHFKWFNDNYGFRKGDSVIKFTANLLAECLGTYGESGDFIGHVGGDDFILITQARELNSLCMTITSRFDREILEFYQSEHACQPIRVITDRSGNPVHSAGIAISLAVLECHTIDHAVVSPERIAQEAGYLKKSAKRVQGSTTVHGKLRPS